MNVPVYGPEIGTISPAAIIHLLVVYAIAIRNRVMQPFRIVFEIPAGHATAAGIDFSLSIIAFASLVSRHFGHVAARTSSLWQHGKNSIPFCCVVTVF